MAAARAESADELATALHVYYGRAQEILEHLGSKPHQHATLIEAVVADPTLLKRWAQSRSQLPDGAEKRAFAKLMIAVHDAGDVAGFDLGPAP